MTRIASLALAGCSLGSTPLTAIPDLPNQQGCGDLSLFATSADGAVRVRFDAPGTVEAAYGGATSASWTADDPAIDLALEQGRNLDQGGCTDVVAFENGEPVVKVDATWLPIAGSASLDVTPTGTVYSECDSPADAVLALDGVVFQSPDGDEVTLDALQVSAGVGWCPG